MSMSGHIQSSENIDWGTPKWILDRVIQTFGRIDLDPASSGYDIVGV